MRKAILCLCASVVILTFASTALARNGVYKFPEIKPEYKLYGGYWFVDVRGSDGAGEYEYLKNSMSMGGDVVAFPFPHRVHLNLDYLNANDYSADISYAYSDKVLSRWINRTLYHNLDNIRLVEVLPNYQVTRDDASEDYGIRSSMNSVFLRFKPVEFPFHVYVDGRFGGKKGSVQQRFLGVVGGEWWKNPKRVSQKRNVDWNTQDITVGVNSHLGPVEVDFSHTEKAFTSGDQRVMKYLYVGEANGLDGTYPHNLIPEMEGSSTTLKLHTSYTGGLVGYVTLTDAVRENTLSGAKAEHLTGAAGIRWAPIAGLSFAVKYKHDKADINNPGSLEDGYYGLAIQNTLAVTGIRPSISSSTDTVSGNVRYRVFSPLTVNVGYTYKETNREDIENDVLDWDVPEKTVENAVSLSARARLPMKLKLKVNYKHRAISDPGSNVQPDRSDGGVVSLTWAPVPRITAFLSYGMTRDKRNNYHYTYKDVNDNDIIKTLDAEDRNADRQKFASSLTYLLKEDLSLTVGYAWFNNRIEQDVLYGTNLDKGIKYEDTADNYSVNISYIPKERITLSAGASWTESNGGFSPDAYNVASLSELDQAEAVYTASGEYGLKSGLGLAMRYKYSDLDNSETSDGTAQTVLMTASMKW